MAQKMQSASSAAAITYPYEVFLSFRESDTGRGFTDVLYQGLNDAGIHVFRDCEDINEISEEILRAIEYSRIFVPIFSRGYASSERCLMELAEMVRTIKNGSSGKKILPVLYDVGAKDVMLNTELYTEALSEHRERFSSDRVQQWKEALQEAAIEKGYEVMDRGHGEFVKSFVREVSLKLKGKRAIVPDYLIQRDDQVESIMKLLDIGSSDVRFIGIHGMGGIGKTLLAKLVFNKLCDLFDLCIFLSDVRESRRQHKDIVNLQNQLLASLGLGSEEIKTNNDRVMQIRKMLTQKKVLLVLDDIDQAEQIQCLAGDAGWFGSGSRIIITTRNRSVLRDNVQTWEMEVMKSEEAIRLFSMHAFDKESPPSDYLRLTDKVVHSSGGLPLALEVIGSHLWNKRKKEWIATIKKLEEVPHKNVQKTLMMSYEALDNGAKQIFLDIACFFTDQDKRYPMYMWEACGFYPKMSLKMLIDMSLVKIVVEDDGGRRKTKKLFMHNQLRDLGMNIVYRESFEGGEKPSRIWRSQDAFEVYKSKQGNENIEMLRGDIHDTYYSFTERKLSSLEKLRYLQCRGARFSGDLKHLLPKLTWLSWRQCPEEDFRATNLYLRNLVILDLSDSNITEDWGGWSQIGVGTNLKVLDLTKCHLRKTPDLSNYSSLERLILEDCKQLVEIDPSIGKLEGLKFLNVGRCISLRSLPESIGRLSGLRRLILSFCIKLERLPDSLADIESLVELDLSHTTIVKLPLGVRRLVKLESLYVSGCKKMENLEASPSGSETTSET